MVNLHPEQDRGKLICIFIFLISNYFECVFPPLSPSRLKPRSLIKVHPEVYVAHFFGPSARTTIRALVMYSSPHFCLFILGFASSAGVDFHCEYFFGEGGGPGVDFYSA